MKRYTRKVGADFTPEELALLICEQVFGELENLEEEHKMIYLNGMVSGIKTCVQSILTSKNRDRCAKLFDEAADTIIHVFEIMNMGEGASMN